MPEDVDRLALLDRRVAALRSARPQLGDALETQAALIRTVLALPRTPATAPFPLPREQAAARLREGVPLLHDQPIQLDIHFAADLFSRLLNTLRARDDPDLRERLDRLIGALTDGAIDPQALFGEAFVHHPDHLAHIAAVAGVDTDLLGVVARQAVGPLLRAYAEHVWPIVERLQAAEGGADGTVWARGYCPVCGGWPLLGELRGLGAGLEPSEWLRCGACGSAWRQPGQGCVYCGKHDPRSLGLLRVDGEPRFRVRVCDCCQGYLKVGNAFDPLPAELLALDDLASVHLDVAATERGYQRPTGGGFRIELAVPDDEWVEELA
jgi:FdhE protein